jgi:hypothetical protein
MINKAFIRENNRKNPKNSEFARFARLDTWITPACSTWNFLNAGTLSVGVLPDNIIFLSRRGISPK